MKIKYILPSILWLTKTALGKIILPSGVPVPEPLLEYFTCPIGNSVCLNGNGRSCHYKYLDYCENDGVQAEKLAEDFDMGNFTPAEFCQVIYDSCHYIDKYLPELNFNDVYNLDEYLSCGNSDTICQYGKHSGCVKALKKCWNSFPVKDCRKLSDTCDSIYKKYNDEVAIFTKDGTRLPQPLSLYYGCLISDISCKINETNKCYEHYNICNPDKKDDLTNYLQSNDAVSYYEPEQYCETHEKACEYIMEHNRSLKDADIYDLDIYNCEDATTSCYYGKRSSCRRAYSMCVSKYPDEVCQNLAAKCDEVDKLFRETKPLMTPTGAEVPYPLYKYFVNDANSKENCIQEYNLYCEDRDQTKFTKLISNYDIENIPYLEFCNVMKESCDMIDDKKTTTITRNTTTRKLTTTRTLTTSKRLSTTRRTSTKKTTTKKTSTRRTTTKKTSTRRTTTKKTSTRRTTTRKTSTRRTTTKRTTTKRTSSRKTTSRRITTRKTTYNKYLYNYYKY